MSDTLRTMLDGMSAEYQKTIGYPTYDILAAVAIAMDRQDEKISEAAGMYDVDLLHGEILRKFVKQRKGIVWNKAVKATATLKAAASGAAIIPQGTIFESIGGVQFEADEEVEIDGTEGMIPVTAVIGGTSGNVGAGAITVIPVTIDGLVSVTNESPSEGGYRAETDDELRTRYYEALQEPVVSGNKNQYKQWALSVPGVGAVRVFPLANGDNTVEVCVIGNDGKPAASTLISAVQEYIDPGAMGIGEGAAPVGAYCSVTTAAAVAINVECTVIIIPGFDSDTVMDAAKKNLDAYLSGVAFETTYISYAHVADVIHDTEGISDYSDLLVNGGTGAVNIGDREVAVLGTVNLSE